MKRPKPGSPFAYAREPWRGDRMTLYRLYSVVPGLATTFLEVVIANVPAARALNARRLLDAKHALRKQHLPSPRPRPRVTSTMTTFHSERIA